MQPSVLPGRDWLHDTPPDKAMWLHVFGRLKPGVTPAQAEAQANAVFQAGLESFYGAAAAERRRELLDQRLQLQSGARGASATRNEFSQSLTALLAAVGVLLLIACANLANLLLARGAARKPEIALRSVARRKSRTPHPPTRHRKSGAGRHRRGGGHRRRVRSSRRAGRDDGGIRSALSHEFRAGPAGAGLRPGRDRRRRAAVRRASGLAGHQNRRREHAQGTEPRRHRLVWARCVRADSWSACNWRFRFPLLVGAGLLARTVYNLQRADLGFPAERLLLVRVDLREAGYQPARATACFASCSARSSGSPACERRAFRNWVCSAEGSPRQRSKWKVTRRRAVRTADPAVDVVGPGYFSTLGVPIRLGREILESDRGEAPRVCVINEAFAKRFFDRRNPIGMRIASIGDDESGRRIRWWASRATPTHRACEATSSRATSWRRSKRSSSVNSPTLLIRTARRRGARDGGRARKTIERVDAALPIMSARSVEEQMAPLTAQDRTTAQLAVVFGVRRAHARRHRPVRRARRMASRAAPAKSRSASRSARSAGRVISMILRETLGLVGAGLALGAGLAYAASRCDRQPALRRRSAGSAHAVARRPGCCCWWRSVAAYLPAQRASRAGSDGGAASSVRRGDMPA